MVAHRQWLASSQYLDMVGASVQAAWMAIRTAAFLFGTYFAWLLTFERWIEPRLRRWTGAIARRSIVWVPAGRGLRIWGVMERSGAATDPTVALVGALLVLASALLPAVLLGRVAGAADPRIAASSYLMSVPLMALFVFRMLYAKHERG
jgi:hypothetical protein